MVPGAFSWDPLPPSRTFVLRALLTRSTPLAALAAFAACSVLHRGGSSPRLDSITPDSVFLAPGAVVEVVLAGRGFAPGAPGRNAVQFGADTIGDVPANDDGTAIRFVIPQQVPLRGDAAPQPLEAGPYTIRVRTPQGTTNAMVVKVGR